MKASRRFGPRDVSFVLIARAVAIAGAGLARAGVAVAGTGLSFGFLGFSVCLHIVILSLRLTWAGGNYYRVRWDFWCIEGADFGI